MLIVSVAYLINQVMREKMSNVISFKGKSTNVTFYEVVDPQGIAVWGGGDVTECVK
jgi:hypothetical protein